MVYSDYTKQKILYHYNEGLKAYSIARKLREEGTTTSRRGVLKFLKHFNETGSIKRREGSGRPSKIRPQMKQLVHEQMRSDDETTAIQLYALLKWENIDISLATILKPEVILAGHSGGSAYCQLIREANKTKHLEWAGAHPSGTFEDGIWTDECSIQMESHKRHCCREGEPLKTSQIE